MSGLVGYVSSDEEDGSPPALNNSKPPQAPLASATYTENGEQRALPGNNSKHEAHPSHTAAIPREDDHFVGPVAAPSALNNGEDPTTMPLSPYSSGRTLVRHLTLPTVPNLDIPSSPPGPPLPGLERRLDQFSQLKQKDIHFNEKLAKSSALKNPSLLGKLLSSAGLEQEDQYASTLPEPIWSPSNFPAWANKDELGNAQQAAQQRRDEELAKTRRSQIGFVPASASEQPRGMTASNEASVRNSAAERVMAGLGGEANAGRRWFKSPGRLR